MIVSYIHVASHNNPTERHTFQVILASDGTDTYAILNYKVLGTDGATVGVAERYCGWTRFLEQTKSSRSLTASSNVGVNGKYVYLLTSRKCLKAG